MDVGAILSRSLSLYKRNLNLLLPHLIAFAINIVLFIAFVALTALILLSMLGSLTFSSIMSLVYGPMPFLLIFYLIFSLIVFLFIGTALSAYARAAVIAMAAEAEKTGKTSLNTGIESAKKHGARVFGYVLAISFVPAIVMMVVGFIITVIAVFVLLAITEGDIDLVLMVLILFTILLFFTGYIIIYILALFSPQKIVLENRGVIDGIKASYGFVKGHPTEVVIYIGVAVAVMVITSMFSMIFAIPRIIFELMDSRFIANFLWIFENFFSIAISLIIAPYMETVKTLMVLEVGGEKSETESPPVL